MIIRALSIRQPWADLILHGPKDVENRSWNTTYRGPFWIHAPNRVELLVVQTEPIASYLREIHGIRRMVDYKPLTGHMVGAAVLETSRERPAPIPGHDDDYSDWHEPGAHGFYLSHRTPLPRPIPMPGGQRWFHPWKRYDREADVEDVDPPTDEQLCELLGIPVPEDLEPAPGPPADTGLDLQYGGNDG